MTVGSDASDESDESQSFDQDDSEVWLDEIVQPGPEHQRLEPLIGDWDATITLWDDGPDEEPLEQRGTVRRRWVLEGLFMTERISHPDGSGGTYRALGYLGYNRMTGLYEHVWMSTDSTAMYSETGRYDPVSDVIRLLGSYTDPGSGFVTQSRTELSISDPDHHTLVVYATEEDGLEYQEMEIVYVRKKVD